MKNYVMIIKEDDVTIGKKGGAFKDLDAFWNEMRIKFK